MEKNTSQDGESMFTKLIRKELNDITVLHEDDKSIAFKDINPVGPIHFQVIPKKKITRLEDADEEDAVLLGHLMMVAKNVAREQGLKKGYRVVLNNGKDGGQIVDYLNLDVIGGRTMSWPPG